MQRHISVLRIFEHDFESVLCLIIPAMFWGLYLLAAVLPFSSQGAGEYVALLMYLAFAITLFALIILQQRVESIVTTFANGHLVDGKISSIIFDRNRGRIEINYAIDGQHYKSTNLVCKNDQAAAYKIGDNVVLIVNNDHPKRAFLYDVFAQAPK